MGSKTCSTQKIWTERNLHLFHTTVGIAHASSLIALQICLLRSADDHLAVSSRFIAEVRFLIPRSLTIQSRPFQSAKVSFAAHTSCSPAHSSLSSLAFLG